MPNFDDTADLYGTEDDTLFLDATECDDTPRDTLRMLGVRLEVGEVV